MKLPSPRIAPAIDRTSPEKAMSFSSMVPRLAPPRHEDPRRLGLELPPELVPVDEMRPDERGQQRNDNGDCQAEQRRLHGVSPRARPGVRPRHAKLSAEAAQYIETSVAKSQRHKSLGRIRLVPRPHGSPGDAKHRPETRGIAALLTMRVRDLILKEPRK